MKTESFRKTAQAIVWPAFAFIVLFTGWMVKQHLSQPDFANAVLYPETSRSIQPFSLIDVNNRVFDKSRLLGKWSFVFFGYTHCPDVCPLTLQTLGQAAELIEKRNGAADVQFIFISVDPQRDNNELLKNYVAYFNPDFLGVSGSQQQLLAFSKALDAPFGKSGDTGSASYSVTHSAQIFLINPDAQRYALLPQPLKAGDIARDFYAIRAHYQQGA